MSTAPVPAPETQAKKLPVPVAVIVAALQSLRNRESIVSTTNEEEGAPQSGTPSPPLHVSQLGYSPEVFRSTSNAYIEAEVETKQGYVYAGKLVDMDADYNITMREATVRRERACDVIRATRRHQRKTLLAQLGALAPRELLEAEEDADAERAGAATRPRYIGSVLLRSSNLLMIRFPQPALAPALASTTAEGKTKGAAADPRNLRAAYKSAAVAVKRAMQNERNKNREARRKRLTATKRKKEGN